MSKKHLSFSRKPSFRNKPLYCVQQHNHTPESIHHAMHQLKEKLKHACSVVSLITSLKVNISKSQAVGMGMQTLSYIHQYIKVN